MNKKTKEPEKLKATNGRKISDVLAEFPDNFSKPIITIGELRDALSGRTYGLLILILALPTLIPMPTPGLSAIVGMPLIFVTFQMMIGIETPWFPGWIEKRSFSRSQMERVLKRIIPIMKKLEIVIKPRLNCLVESPAEHFIAAICLGLSWMIILPIPFGNALPAFCICLFALAILQHDGLLALLGIIAAAISCTVIYLFMDTVISFGAGLF